MTAQKESEFLMKEMLPLAERMLRDHGEFYPYGGYLRANGEITHLGVQDGDTDHPKSKDMLYLLRESLSGIARENKCRATAIVFAVSINLPGGTGHTDAIQINLEHKDGYSAEVFFPYEISENHEVIYGASFAQEGGNEIFS
jgi:hypothetical protein